MPVSPSPPLSTRAVFSITRARYTDTMHTTIAAIDACLPQTQCGQCGYAGCAPYAAAIVNDNVAINRCPPGGDTTIALLATLLGQPALPLDHRCGTSAPRQRAVIDELRCIGCALCLKACPLDAIIGARKHMHTIVTSACSGCGLCLAPCPVDCIRLNAAAPAIPGERWPEYRDAEVDAWRRAYGRHIARAQDKVTGGARSAQTDRQRAKAEIAAAVARVRRRRATA